MAEHVDQDLHDATTDVDLELGSVTALADDDTSRWGPADRGYKGGRREEARVVWTIRITGGGNAGRSIELLEDGVYIIGRATDNDIPLQDTGASRRHAELVLADDAVELRDLGSSNGTLVDGDRVDGNATLKVGSCIRIGRSELHLARETAVGELRLVALSGPAVGAEVALGEERTTIGRDGDNDLQLEDGAVSGLHAMLEQRGDRVVIRDCNSHNGTFVNDHRVEDEALLRGGDVIKVGASALEFVDGRVDDLHDDDVPGYGVIERIGAGSLGVVYKARRRSSGDLVALKVLDPTVAGDAADRARLINAARAASRIDHQNIQKVLDVGVAGDTAWIASEWAAHGSLGDLIRAGEPVPAAVAAALALDAARGLAAAADAGLVHPGLRPGDVVIGDDGIGRISDLGLSAPDAREDTGTAATPSYRATEELDGGEASEASNQFSLGALIYHAIACRPPYSEPGDDAERGRSAPPLRELVPETPPEITRVVMRLLDPDPAARFPTWPAVITELERSVRSGVRSLPIPEGEAPRRPPSTRTRSARPAQDAMPAGVKRLLVVVGVLAFGLIFLAVMQRYMR